MLSFLHLATHHPPSLRTMLLSGFSRRTSEIQTQIPHSEDILECIRQLLERTDERILPRSPSPGDDPGKMYPLLRTFALSDDEDSPSEYLTETDDCDVEDSYDYWDEYLLSASSDTKHDTEDTPVVWPEMFDSGSDSDPEDYVVFYRESRPRMIRQRPRPSSISSFRNYTLQKNEPHRVSLHD